MKRWALGLAVMALVSGAARADYDGGLPFKMVNPGDDGAPLFGEMSDRSIEEALAAMEALEAMEDAGISGVAQPIVPPKEPAPDSSPWHLSAQLAAMLRLSGAASTSFPIDSEGTAPLLTPLVSRVRVAPEIHVGPLGVVIEADAATGAVVGVPSVSLVGDRVPVPPLRALEMRKFYGEYRWETGAFRVGQQTSHWGLGLVANDGAHDPQAGDFGQQHFGNLTYRALLVARPFFGWGRAFRAVEVATAADLVIRDNFGVFAQGDRAFQGVLALRFAKDSDHNLGLYAVYRHQRNALSTDGGKAMDVVVIDFAGQWQLLKQRKRDFQVGWEMAGVTGTSTQARNENASRLTVAQFGAAIKTRLRVGRTFVFLDGGYASGDQNPSDDRIENFRFDRDFKVGLILFDQVLAYQSARSSVRASDPSLVGVAPEGADLLGTAGSVTGAWYLFPRVKIALADWLDGYGGPLFAFSTAKLVDPFNSRIQGGAAVNALGGTPGYYLGTEFDVGAQARFAPRPELKLSLTAEGGVFLPGDALTLPQGGVMAPVGFGRIRLGVGI